MKALRYDQQNGFSEVEDVESALDIKLPESWQHCGEALGRGWTLAFQSDDTGEGGCGPRVVFYEDDADGDRGTSRWVVALDDGYRAEWIIVEGAHNIVALRVALAPLIQLGLIETLLVRGTAAGVRRFIHEHGHDPLWPCPKCETDPERSARKDWEQRQAERRAKEKTG